MEAGEKERVLRDLRHGTEVLLTAVLGIKEEVAAFVPAPGKWSILECVEHLAVSEDYLFSQIGASRYSEAPTINENRESLIMERALDRTRKVESPEVGRPTQRFSTLADALQHFSASRERTVRFVEGCEEDLRRKITSHPIIGTVNCYEILLMMALHPLRHAKQIEETRAALSLEMQN